MAAASGELDVDAGALPGVESITVSVVAAGCTTSSQVEAWLIPKDTADHSLDEHLVDPPSVVAHSPLAGSFSVTLSARPDVGIAWYSIALRGGAGSKLPSKRSPVLVYGEWRIGWVHS